MSFLNNPLTLVAVALLGGLGFVLSVHQFSKEQTAAHLRRVEQIRAEEKVAQDRAEAARLEVLNARVAAAAVHQAKYAAAMKKPPGPRWSPPCPAIRPRAGAATWSAWPVTA